MSADKAGPHGTATNFGQLRLIRPPARPYVKAKGPLSACWPMRTCAREEKEHK